MHTEETEVLIIGAGPVGMFTALLLARRGVGVRIIDQAPEVADQSYACGLHGRSVKLLREAGIGDDLVKHGRCIDTVAFYEGGTRRVEIDLAEVTPAFPHLLTVPQATLETLLERSLNEAGVPVTWSRRLADVRFDSGGATALVEELCGTATGYDVPRWETVVNQTSRCSAQFVVGADGCHSALRRLLGISSEPFAKPELFVVYEFHSDAAESNEMVVALNESDRNVFWPLPNQRCRWGFQWTDTEPDGEFPPKHRGGVWFEDQPIADRTRQHLHQLLEARVPWFRGSVGEIDWASDVQFEPHLAKQFGRGRGWLVGDAAHQTGPVGMQSMNVGLREAEVLAEALANILRGRGAAPLLETYERGFRQEWLDLLGATSLVTPNVSQARIHLRNSADVLSCLPASNMELDAMFHSLGLEWKRRASHPQHA